MPTTILSPSLRIPIELLTPASFHQFGTVIENPTHSQASPTQPHPDPPKAVPANQGSALKLLDVTHMTNLYTLAPSKKPAKAVMNMFICAPRDLRPHEPSASMPSSWGDLDFDDDDEDGGGITPGRKELFDVNILERHPFTTQTFIPMGLAGTDRRTQYLVIVAPTLPRTEGKDGRRPPPFPTPRRRRKRSITDIFARARPSPFTNEAKPPGPSLAKLHPSQRPKGPGLPDLKNIRAFLACGSQAVTYGAGTWHAPMVVLGDRPVDFVVVQFANDVGMEDCQEVILEKNKSAEEGIVVQVCSDSTGRIQVRAGVGSVKAKL